MMSADSPLPPDNERASLDAAWRLAALAQPPLPSADDTDAATERFWASVAARPVTQDRPARPRALGWQRIATSALLLMLGISLGWALAFLRPEASASPVQATHVLFVRGGTFAAASPDVQARIVEEYAAWARQLATERHLVLADQLADPGYRLIDAATTASPLVRPPEGISGYFLIHAASDAAALALAETCPHLRYGGFLEVRRIIRP